MDVQHFGFAQCLQKAKKYFALALIGAWWLLSFSLFSSPWPLQYLRTNFTRILLLVVISLLLLTIAFVAGLRFNLRQSKPFGQESIPKFGAVIALALMPFAIATYSAYSLTDVVFVFTHQSDVYASTQELLSDGSSSHALFLVVSTVLSPLTLTALPYFTFQWLVHRSHFLWMVSSFIPLILLSVFTGRDQSLGIALIISVAVWSLAFTRGLSLVQQAKNAALIMSIGVLFVVQSALRKVDRASPILSASPTIQQSPMSETWPGTITSLNDSSSSIHSLSPTIQQSPMCETWPGTITCLSDSGSAITNSVRMIDSYMSQGFEGLGRAFETEWRFGGGFSHSPALANALDILGISHASAIKCAGTVSEQLACHEWDSRGNWSTGFTQLANDVPWVLIPVIVMALGLLLSIASQFSNDAPNYLSIAVFAYTFFTLFWIPQNLQIASSGPFYFGYLFLVGFLLVSIRRRT